MNKIFYKPNTLQIMGMSDGDPSMEYPYVETDMWIHALYNFKIVKDENGTPKLVVPNGYFDGVEPQQIDLRVQSPLEAIELINKI